MNQCVCDLCGKTAYPALPQKFLGKVEIIVTPDFRGPPHEFGDGSLSVSSPPVDLCPDCQSKVIQEIWAPKPSLVDTQLREEITALKSQLSEAQESESRYKSALEKYKNPGPMGSWGARFDQLRDDLAVLRQNIAQIDLRLQKVEHLED